MNEQIPLKKVFQIFFLTLLVFLLGIGFSMAETSQRSEKTKAPASMPLGGTNRSSNPADIRGSSSLEDIGEAFEIPVDTLAVAFGVSGEKNPAAIRAQELDQRYGRVEGLDVGTDSLRLFVSLYVDRPFIPGEETGLPWIAYAVLKQRALITDEESLLCFERLVHLPTEQITAPEDRAPAPHKVPQIKERTLFFELLDQGAREEQISLALAELSAGSP